MFFILFLSGDVLAQKWQIERYNIAYRIFEISAVGNNPTTIAPLLKEPEAYQRYLNTITNNSLYGNPAIFPLHTFYVNAEWQKHNSLSRFWRKHTVQTGLVLTSLISQNAGAIGDQRYLDTVRHRYMYSLNRIQRFAGATAGLNRQIKLSKRSQILAGIQGQGKFAIAHHYQQTWDSTTYTRSGGWMESITRLSDLKGKNFFQWQVMLPIAFEYLFYKESLSIRLELVPGIIGSRYRPKSNSAKEAHGAGIGLAFKPKSK
jgi:hypothetical protein